MADIIVRIIQLLVGIGLGVAVIAMFTLAMVTIVHGLHTAGRQH